MPGSNLPSVLGWLGRKRRGKLDGTLEQQDWKAADLFTQECKPIMRLQYRVLRNAAKGQLNPWAENQSIFYPKQSISSHSSIPKNSMKFKKICRMFVHKKALSKNLLFHACLAM
jgi:hypothetical protein